MQIAPAAAAPITSSLMLRSAVGPSVETVQYRRGWRGGYRGGAGIGIGAGIAGALIGGAIIGATQPYEPLQEAAFHAERPAFNDVAQPLR